MTGSALANSNGLDPTGIDPVDTGEASGSSSEKPPQNLHQYQNLATQTRYNFTHPNILLYFVPVLEHIEVIICGIVRQKTHT